jgi:hypothetical protein
MLNRLYKDLVYMRRAVEHLKGGTLEKVPGVPGPASIIPGERCIR